MRCRAWCWRRSSRLWLGLGIWSKVALGVTLVFFIVFFNVYQGVKEVSPTVLANARMLGMNERQLMRHVYWPSALSWMFSSLHTSVGFAVVGAVVGEYLGSAAGLGYLIQQAEGVFDVAGVFAGMFVLAAFVIVIDTIVTISKTPAGLAAGGGRRKAVKAFAPSSLNRAILFSADGRNRRCSGTFQFKGVIDFCLNRFRGNCSMPTNLRRLAAAALGVLRRCRLLFHVRIARAQVIVPTDSRPDLLVDPAAVPRRGSPPAVSTINGNVELPTR